MGVRYQVYPRDADSQILLHIRLLDPSNLLQQEAIGIIGVNLLYAAFFLHFEPDELIASLIDDLGPNRVEVDMIEFSGIGFRAVDNRLMSLRLVQMGLSKAAMFDSNGKVLQPSEVFYKNPVLVERGSFRPVCNVHFDILRSAKEKFLPRIEPEDQERVVTIAEIGMKNLATPEMTNPDARDFLARADVMCAAGMTVLISDFFEFYRLSGYLRQFTHKPIGISMGAVTIPEIFDPKYYTHLEGGLLEALGRLFRGDLSLFIYPYRNKLTGNITTVDNLELPSDIRPLYEYIRLAGRVIPLDNYSPDCLSIESREVYRKIGKGEVDWEQMVPPAVADLIKRRNMFGYHQ